MRRLFARCPASLPAHDSLKEHPDVLLSLLLRRLSPPTALLAFSILLAFTETGSGQGSETPDKPLSAQEADVASVTGEVLIPKLIHWCGDCHQGEDPQSGIRVDRLGRIPRDREILLWEEFREQIVQGKMPPEDAPQLDEQEKAEWLEKCEQMLHVAKSLPVPNRGGSRRMTVAQFQNTLHDLLDWQVDLTARIPPDAISKDGFTNHVESMGMSPAVAEAYFDVADHVVSNSLIDPSQPPAIQAFQMAFGRQINPAPCPDALVLGANSLLLPNSDFVVTENFPEKPFPYEPLRMQRTFRFIEGYVGNDTIREWKEFDSIYHAVFACMRGTPGYPLGLAYESAPDGLLLRPAIPSPEIFGESNTYGPMANFKISLRELPSQGRFRVTVRAKKLEDAQLLSESDLLSPSEADPLSVVIAAADLGNGLQIADDGIYQLDVVAPSMEGRKEVRLLIDGLPFTHAIAASTAALPSDAASDQLAKVAGTPMLRIRLSKGEHEVAIDGPGAAEVEALCWRKLAPSSKPATDFEAFEGYGPFIGVHVGLRRDCGSTLNPVGPAQRVASTDWSDLVFEGAIENFPSPDVEKNNVNYLAGIREIGVRSEYYDGRPVPRLCIANISFEGPYLTQWPPPSHQQLAGNRTLESIDQNEVREPLGQLATRMFRRPATADEVDHLLSVYQKAKLGGSTNQEAYRDAATVVLASPSSFFLHEASLSDEAEPLSEWELASKLSYFLWNGPPDDPLLKLAESGRLTELLDQQIDRLLVDPRRERFLQTFVRQWLQLEKLDLLAIDRKTYPEWTRDLKASLRQEPIAWVGHLLDQNLPASHLVDSPWMMANEVTAAFYKLPDRPSGGPSFELLRTDREQLGGLLGQAGLMAALGDGRQSNPIKRGAWLARKLVDRPPEDPPPNVPKLPEGDISKETFLEKLNRHRNQPGCAACHEKIDPWGIPLQNYNASGCFVDLPSSETTSQLADGTKITNAIELKKHLAGQLADQVAWSFARHLACYAIGRDLTYSEAAQLKTQVETLAAARYPMRSLLRTVIHSDAFMTK
ncbi:MAG: DUF1592 domain-containing protein [Pirellulaceae bacterium]